MTDPERQSPFPETRWSLVLAVQRPSAKGGEEESARALEELCRCYWRPVFHFIRQTGKSGAEAEDLVQSFFERILAGSFFEHLSKDRGRLRNYLLRSLKNHLASEWERQSARKRGGMARFVFIDADQADELPMAEKIAAESESPDEAFDRRWACELLTRGLGRLEAEYRDRGKGELFARLSPQLSQPNEHPSERVAAELGISPNAARIALHRLKRRFQALVRDEVRETLEPGADVEEELRHLAWAMGRS